VERLSLLKPKVVIGSRVALHPHKGARLLSPTEFMGRKVLNDVDKHWARVELRRYDQQRIEFWAKLIFPILSLIMSIIALVVSIHKI
jgi:hypothetical protein